jgi:hypothetical protein
MSLKRMRRWLRRDLVLLLRSPFWKTIFIGADEKQDKHPETRLSRATALEHSLTSL